MHQAGTSDNGMYDSARATHRDETNQESTWTESWPEIWAERRIGDLVRRSGDRELATLEQQLREKVYPLLFGHGALKNDRPNVIHGDMWNGNSGLEFSSDQPIIFDPSSSYSHNEAELGIMKMLGGHSPESSNAYHAAISKAHPYYKQRQELYEAYHHLNHHVTFGSGCPSGAVRIFKELIAWADEERQRGGALSGRNDDSNGEPGGSGHRHALRGGGSTRVSNPGASLGNFAVGGSSRGFGSLTSEDNDPPVPAPSAADFGTTANDLPHFGQQAVPTNAHGVMPSYTMGTAAPSQPAPLPLAPTPAQIADFFSQMICYIWYSDKSPGQSRASTPARSPTCRARAMQMSPRPSRWPMTANPYFAGSYRGSNLGVRRTHAKTASTGGLRASTAQDAEMSRAIQSDLLASAMSSPTATEQSLSALASDPLMLRLQPKGRFLRFTRDLLATTQVSTSVITLALIYVARLKALHPKMKGREGSEYRLTISSLMLANKILDDNTYLNKTWAEISDMPLIEISKMETEFWLGLKMELHITKDEYDAGLRDLQTLAASRANAIREREALLKRAAMQQQQQSQMLQQQQRQLLHQRRLSKPIFAQEHLFQANRHSMPYSAPQWSASSECLYAPQTHAWRMHMPGRYSAGNIDMTTPYSDSAYASMNKNGAAEMQSPECSMTNLSNPSPDQGATLTVPSSPMSPGSNAPSLAMTSNEALICSDGEARTPQDFFVSGQYGDAAWKAHLAGMSRTQHSDHAQEWANGMSLIEGGLGNHEAPFMQPRPKSATYQQQPQSGLPHLKRDFDRANLGSVSPMDLRSAKRFAHDAATFREQQDGYRQIQYPTMAQSMQHSAFSPTAMRQSFNPSMSTYSPQNDAPSTATYHGLSGALQSPSVLMQASSSRHPSPHSRYGLGDGLSGAFSGQQPSSTQTAQYSAFSSALTPTSLIAPLTSASGNQHLPTLKSRGPLQYYSLAAGEPRGVLGTYIPPTSYPQTMNSSAAAAQQYFPGFDGTSASSYIPQSIAPMSPKSGNMAWSAQPQHQSMPAEQRPAPLSYTASEPLVSGRLSALPQPSQAAGASQWGNSQAAPALYAQQTGGGMPLHMQATGTQQQVPQAPQTSYGQVVQQPPPFALDVHAWPLMGNSTTASYLFPYHLMPPMPVASAPTSSATPASARSRLIVD